MRLRHFLLCLLFLSLLAPTSNRAAEASDAPAFNPETVLLSHFTLFRPPGWQWVQTTERDQNIYTEVVFSVGDPQDANNDTMIFFNHAKPNVAIATPEATAARWTKWFEPIQSTTPLSAETIGTNKVSYIEITGNFHGPQPGKKQAKAQIGYTLFGAHIEDNDGNIMIRLVGPGKMVEKTKATLKDMIKKMLQE